MKKCDCCGRELGQYDDLYLVNDGLPNERYECYNCHVDKLETEAKPAASAAMNCSTIVYAPSISNGQKCPLLDIG